MRINRLVLIGAATLLVAVVAVVGVGTWLRGSDLTGGGSGTCGPVPELPGNPPEAGRAPAVELPASAVRTVATGLCVPWGVAFLPDGTALVTERRTARILSVTPGGRVTEVQRLSGLRDIGEVGLLGIAVSPDYASDRWVYVYYSTEDDNRIARLHLGEPPQPILTGIPVSDFHAGGRLAFGPDGMLYATTGETYETREIAQDRNSLGGKILRITPDGRPAPGNPFGTAVYSLGHRNPQGLAWDAKGRLYSSELGENLFDELNLIRPGGNYGWPVVEGVGNDRRFVDPIATFTPAEASPSGIAIVGDRVYVAALRGRRLFRVGLDGRNAEKLLDGDYGRLRTVIPAPDGSLWVTTSNRDQISNNRPFPGDDKILRLDLKAGGS